MKCLIIGSGPAGYTAAIYAARANMNPVLYEGLQPGGQLTVTTEVENFPGYPEGVDPYTLMDDLRRQAERFGTEVRTGVVTKVDFSVSPKLVWIDDAAEPIEADAVIIATGASAKWLGIKSENDYRGMGVSACATCDGFFYRGKVTAVVGGGELNNPKIEVLFEHNTIQLTGEGRVQGADLVYKKDTPEEEMRHIDIDGFFLAIGHRPNSKVFSDYVALDEEGYVRTIPGTPKDLLTYLVGLTPMKLHSFLLLTTLARIPSVVSSAMTGNFAQHQRWTAAIVTYSVTILISAVCILWYRRISRQDAGQGRKDQKPV